MVEQATTGNNPESGSSVGAIVGWGLLAVGTIAFIWFIFTQLAVGWEGREQEALDLVKSYQGPGMKYKLSDQTIAVGNAARAKGHFVGEFHWGATQDKGATYKVELIWKEDSATRKAAWVVDLQQQTVVPEGTDAAEFMKPVDDSAG